MFRSLGPSSGLITIMTITIIIIWIGVIIIIIIIIIIIRPDDGPRDRNM
jgi:heme/copper-type cytochrome/quinol oxidase subunit 2